MKKMGKMSKKLDKVTGKAEEAVEVVVAARQQAMDAKSPSSGSTLYVIQDPESSKDTRMMKCVKGEGTG